MATITKSPKFFKVVVNLQDNKLRIPTGFIRKHGLTLPDEVTLKAPGGSLRQIELVQFEGDTWLHKGWEEFRDFYSIGFGHVLVFDYDGKSHFDVSILGMTTVEIEYPLDDADEGEGYQVSEMETELSESESEDSAEIVKKRKMSYGKDKRTEVEGQLCKERMATILDKETSVAFRKANAFKSDKPFCICFMQPSYITQDPAVLLVPARFMRESFPVQEKMHKLRLRVQEKGIWPVTCSLSSGRGRLIRGWGKFVEDNSLKVGDVCVFEADRCEKLLWDVTIFRG